MEMAAMVDAVVAANVATMTFNFWEEKKKRAVQKHTCAGVVVFTSPIGTQRENSTPMATHTFVLK